MSHRTSGWRSPPFAYGISLVAWAAALTLRWLLDPVLGDSFPTAMFYAATAVAVWIGGYRPAILVALLGFVAAAYLFVEPRGALGLGDASSLVGLLTYTGTSAVIIGLGEATRSAYHRAHEAELQIARQQAETLQVTFASIGDAVITTDADGTVAYLNPVAEKLTGWKLDEACGEPLESVFHIINEQTRQPVENPVAKVLKLGQVMGLANHTVLVGRDGVERPIDDSAAPIRQRDGRVSGVVLVFRDVSEQKRAHEARARLAAIVESSDDAIVGKSMDGVIRSWNTGAERIFGYTAEEAVGRHISLIIPPERIAEEDEILRRLRAGKRVDHFESVRLRKDGRPVQVSLTISPIKDDHGRIVGASKIARDITSQKHSQQRLATQDAVTRALAKSQTLDDAAPQILRVVCEHLQWAVGSLWYVDSAANVLRCSALWNMPSVQFPEFATTTLQRTFEPGVGLPGRVWSSGKAAWIPDVVKDDNFPRAPIADREGLHGAFGFPIALNNEVLGVIEFFSHEIRHPDDEILQMMTAVGTQIGQFIERKRVEENLRKSERHLREVDRRKDEFLATLAHELRNPLAPLRNMLEILKRTDGDLELLHMARDTMDRQLTHMVRLVDDLLDVSRITQDKLELRKQRIELMSVIYQAIETCRPIIQCSTHDIEVKAAEQPIYLDGDPVRLAQVFSNLINNACKYMEDGGTIWVTTERQGSDVVVTVKDCGIGLAPDMLAQVFEMFTQADRSLDRAAGGLGIGLTLVKRLVEMHGGSVQAASDGVGCGSEFTVRLPISVETTSGEKTKRSPAKVPLTGRRVLVVDDNMDSARSLAMLLRIMGNETQAAHDGASALEAAERFRPELVLLDIGLPKMNGYDVCRAIREQPWGQDMALVALTGWGQEEDRRKSQEAGFDGHLVKPIDYQALGDLLAELQLTSREPATPV